ncbi:MAG: Hydrogen peroxide-inducible genes activator [Alphaproteobacteria bacterium MarineAlpha3_Bin5]|nr:MAG: Hydrogen peroxide-inducible genes activator [Alphaproteobacteria bacterium MarineAlpha3_Bin5]
MFFRQLQYLIALSEEEHFGRAATRCHVSQPSLSSAIKQLELSLGVPIVLRGRRFLGFTKEGLRVIEWARRVIAQRDAMLVELSNLRENFEGRMRLGAMPNSSPLLPLFSQAITKKHPGVQIEIKFLGIEETKLGLSSFDLDVGISYIQEGQLDSLNSIPLYLERLSLLVPDTKEYAEKNQITWKEAAELPLCLLDPSMYERQVIDEAFRRIKKLPKPRVIASDSIFNLIFHVMHAGSVTIIPHHFMRTLGKFPGVKALDLVDPVVNQQVGLLWSPTEPIMPMANVLISIVKEFKKSGELENWLGDHRVS